MSEAWQYQLRVYLPDDLAEVARVDRDSPVLRDLTLVLDKHRAVLVSQFDAFSAYVAEAEAEGAEKFPLYRWTKAVLDDPSKRAKHVGAFAVRVAGAEVYSKAVADALEADLLPLVGGGVVGRISRHDTDPAHNMPVPEAYRG